VCPGKVIVSDVAAGNPIQQVPHDKMPMCDSACRASTRRLPGVSSSPELPKRPAGRPGRSGFPWKNRPRVDFGQRAAIKRAPVSHPLPEPVPPLEVRSAISIAAAGPAAAKAWKERAMTLLRWALLFFLISIVAGVLGFTGLSEATADIARFLFYVFVVIFLVLLILGLTIFRI
jgi:uncharacterized membrane protein YtjA (UPF0391 family)